MSMEYRCHVCGTQEIEYETVKLITSYLTKPPVSARRYLCERHKSMYTTARIPSVEELETLSFCDPADYIK